MKATPSLPATTGIASSSPSCSIYVTQKYQFRLYRNSCDKGERYYVPRPLREASASDRWIDSHVRPPRLDSNGKKWVCPKPACLPHRARERWSQLSLPELCRPTSKYTTTTTPHHEDKVNPEPQPPHVIYRSISTGNPQLIALPTRGEPLSYRTHAGASDADPPPSLLLSYPRGP